MIQNPQIRSQYMVNAGEQVTIEIEAHNVGNTAGLVIDGGPLTPISTTPLTFQFTVSVGPGDTHFGMIDCFFAPNTPNEAFFQVFATGNIGNTTRFKGSDIRKTDPTFRRSINFTRLE